MKFIKLLTLLLWSTAFTALATDITGGIDPLEKRYIQDPRALPDVQIQKMYRDNELWKSFVTKHNRWYVAFDERSGMPHRASGQPIQTQGSDPVSAAESFIQAELSGYLNGIQELKFQSHNFSGKYFNVFYFQQYHGIDVLNSRVFIKLTPDLRVSTFGVDVYKIAGLDHIPAISESQAKSLAAASITHTVEKSSDAFLKILPLPVQGTYEYRLVYELTVMTLNENKVPGAYYSLIDAHSGELLYRQNRVRYSHPQATDFNVIGSVSLNTPFQPLSVLPLPNLRVDDGSNMYFTDSLGQVVVPGAGQTMATVSLSGRWSSVYTDAGNVSPSITALFDPGQVFLSFDSLTNTSHVSGYYHVNIVHDFMKSFLPTFPSLDFALPTRIDLPSGSCNAFYAGSDINFYEPGGGCHSLAQVGDVVYHEYGHGINDKFYQWQGSSWDNGGMGEGYADVWGFSITNLPTIGGGYRTSNPNSFIRRYDQNKKVYPQNLIGQVHADGEIIAGAWYDLALNLGSMTAMTELFASTYFDLITGPDGNEGQIYADILLAALNQDDDDADLSNGTPNDSAIIAAFALHGISLLNNVEISHTEVNSAARFAPIAVEAAMAVQFPWYTIDVMLHYRENPSGTWNQMLMTGNGSGQYTANIPGKASGTIIEYFLESRDITGNPLSTSPDEANLPAANIPYFILVDFEQKQIEDFDNNQSAGWLTGIPSDNASSGFWIIDVPVPSYQNGNILCQPGFQHTPGGTRCAVTGNAPLPTSQIGYSDVDGGRTTLQSPVIDISSYTIPAVSYWRWYTNDQGSTPRTDDWQTYISADGVNFVSIEFLDVPDHSWRRFAFKVHDHLPGATEIILRFVAEDAGNGSLIEAAVDDVEIMDVSGNVSVQELSKDLSATIFPNPVNSEFILQVRSNKPSDGEIMIVNALGQLVISAQSKLNEGLNQVNFSAELLPSGIYRLVVRSGNSVINLPLSVIRD